MENEYIYLLQLASGYYFVRIFAPNHRGLIPHAKDRLANDSRDLLDPYHAIIPVLPSIFFKLQTAG